jgi:catechol 2,3-dioxygenase-like lactoylglutathione lyase family enzyme
MKFHQPADAPAMPPVQGLHHFAYKRADAEETRRFYEDVMGFPLVHCIEEHDVPTTTGDTVSFLHIFFKMADGRYVAFFDLGDERVCAKDPETPQFANHLALAVDGEAELLAAKDRLEAAGLEVIGPMDHDGFVRSIYFWDPNGVRLELTYTIADAKAQARSKDSAHAQLKRWTQQTSPAVNRRRKSA